MRSTLLRTACTLLLSPLLWPCSAVAQRPIAGTRRIVADSCLPPSEFQLQGIELHADGGSPASTLGRPARTTITTGEDDGGRYEIQTYHYPALSIDVVRGMVDRLMTRSPGVSTPSGLRPGLTFDAANTLLKTKGIVLKQRADTVDIGTCSPSSEIILEDYLTLMFDRSGHLQVLELSVARP